MTLDPYARLLRPLLFRLPADTAHEFGRLALASPGPWRVPARLADAPDPRLRTRAGGLELATPIGLAPGFDKNGDLVPALCELGFGYIVVGSITSQPRAGNPRPRLIRYPDRQAVANCMGMPNVGVAAAAERLRRPRSKGTRVIAAVAGATPEEVVEAAATLAPLADGIEIGLVCRHSPETFEMAELPTVRTIIEGVMARRSGPVFIKIPPHHSPAERSRSLAIVDLCLSAGVDGVSVSGTSRVAEAGLSTGEGGLAGRATTPDALRILEDIAGRALGRLAIKAAGGVFSGADAYRFLSAGATTVEVYSAFIYRGWTVGRTLAAELAGELGRRHLGSVAAIGRRETVEPGGVSA